MKFTKGLNRDVDPSNQPEGTYRDLKNAVVNEELGSIQVDDGTTEQLSSSKNIIDTLYINENTTLLFVDDSGTSEIISVDLNNGTINGTVLQRSDLNFDQASYFDATHTVNNRGEIIVYWTDGVNPPRFYNITTQPSISDLGDISLFPHYNRNISFNLESVDSSAGSLQAGVYYLTFAYIDEDQTLTDYFYVTQPIPILGPDGRGADSDQDTGKSITFTLNNLDVSYQRIRISAIRGTDVQNIQDIEIGDGNVRYTFTGNEDETVGSLDEVLIDNPIYNEANTLQQHDNNLYLGGLRNRDLTKSQKESLQSVALNTDVSVVFSNEDLDSYKDPTFISQKRGFKRGEVYALYMSFIKDDGQETEVFHIPGRDPITNETINSKASVNITEANLPSESTAIRSLGSIDDLPSRDGSVAIGGWEIEGDANDETVAHDVNLDFSDSGGNSLLNNIVQQSTAGGESIHAFADDIATSLNTEFQSSGIDGDWEAVAPDTNGTVSRVEVRSKAVGTQWNGNLIGFATDSTGDPGEIWRKLDGGAQYDYGNGGLSTYETDPTEDGVDSENGTLYGNTITITITRNNGAVQDVIDLNDTNDTNLNDYSWGGGNPFYWDDSAATARSKLVALMTDTSNQSGNPHTSEFTNIQNDYTFYEQSGEVVIESKDAGEYYNGEININDETGGDPSLGVDVPNQTIIGGFTASDGVKVDLTVPSSITSSYTASYTYTNSDTPNTIADALVTELQNQAGVSDLSYSHNLGNIEIEETDTDGSYVGESPDFSSEYNTISYTIQSYSSVVTLSEKDPLDGSNPLSGNGYEYYQVFATPNSNNTGYWENNNETYPNEEPFISEGINGDKIKHHRVSGPTYSPNTYNGSSINIAGFQLSNINISDSELQDKIVGYKLYYAKKNGTDRLILDQGSINSGFVDLSIADRGDHGSDDEVFSSDVLTTHGFDIDGKADENGDGSYNTGPFTWDIDKTFGYVRPPYLMVNKESISGVTHVRGVYKIENDHTSIDQTTISQDNVISDGDSEWVRRVDAKSYIDKNQRNISLESLGFTYDMDNLFGESKIALQFDSNYISETGERVVSDICQIQDDVHTSYEDQKLVDTGIIGEINNGNQSTAPVAWGGDVYVGENYYKANTLLTVDGIENNSWKNYWVESIWNAIYSGGSSTSEIDAVKQAIRSEISGSSNVENVPFPYSTLYGEVIESRLNTSILYSGESDEESVFPQRSDWVARPDVSEIPAFDTFYSDEDEIARATSQWWTNFFKESDNYPEWNSQYSSLQDVKTSFPWSPFNITNNDNYNRVIRSAGDEDGRSQSFRSFRENDYIDLPRNRGDIVSLDVLDNNLIVHLERAIIQTRGREELKTRDFEVFLGSGNIFEVKPNELLSTEVGFGGLQNINDKTNCEDGYFWIDKEAGGIYRLSPQGLEDLSSQQYGLNNWIDDNLSTNNDISVGYDSHNSRVMFNSNDWNITFYPDQGIWGSYHTYYPDQFIRTLNDLYTIKNNNIHYHSDEYDTIYDNSSFPFEIEYAIPHGAEGKVTSLYYDTEIDETNNTVSFDEVEISNNNQTTGNVSPVYSVTFADDTYLNNSSSSQVRKRQGFYWLNKLREENLQGSSNLPDWARKKKLEDTYHIVRLKKTIDSNINNFELLQSGIIFKGSLI